MTHMITIQWKNDDGTEFAAVDIPISNAQRNALLDWWRAQPGNLKPLIDIDTPQEQYGRPAAARRLSRALFRRALKQQHDEKTAEMIDAAVAAARAKTIASAGQPIEVPDGE